MNHEERLAMVSEAVAKYDTIRPTVSVRTITKEIVHKWEEEERCLKDHIHRYFVAVHGEDYVYSAPETFPNVLEQWMLIVAAGDMKTAEKAIVAIENHFKSVRNG